MLCRRCAGGREVWVSSEAPGSACAAGGKHHRGRRRAPSCGGDGCLRNWIAGLQPEPGDSWSLQKAVQSRILACRNVRSWCNAIASVMHNVGLVRQFVASHRWHASSVEARTNGSESVQPS